VGGFLLYQSIIPEGREEKPEMNELTIIKLGGGAYIDSRQVAEYIGKRHDHLLRDIDGYLQILDKSGVPNFGGTSFFIKSSYVDSWNREKPAYLISRRGADIIANKLTGEKGVLFTAAYVTKFHEMSEREHNREISEIEKQAATPRLKVFNTAVRNVMGGFTYTRSSPGRVMDFLRGAYKPFGIAVVEQDEHCAHTLSATDIAVLHSVYSESGRPHSHAVAAIIEKLNIDSQHFAVVPFSLVGVAMRYDFYVYNAVGEWLEANNYPRHIPHLDFEYHIYYDQQSSFFGEDFDPDYTSDELDELCVMWGDCDLCPGKRTCWSMG
jgi:Rha family phage regulatory protein